MNYRQVNLDFHTSEHIGGVGTEFDKKEFQQTLKRGHIDSITLFSKCHHGWSYHPTSVGEMHPQLSFDLLGSQLEAAREIGVKTPIYVSSGFDEKSFREHPEWRCVDECNGIPGRIMTDKPMFHSLCFNTKYVDYLLAQIEEVLSKYDTDSLFVDISCPKPCYCETCRETLIKEGKDPDDRRNIWELADRVYKSYACRIAEVANRCRPGISIFHNGGHIARGRRDLVDINSHIEIESLPTGGWGYDDLQLSARYVQTLDKDYLAMTGRFHSTWGEFGSYKTENAFRYEASLAAALGAKVSIGDQLSPTGKMDALTYKYIGKAYGEIEEKEPWLKDVEFVCDIGVLSAEAYGAEKGCIDLDEYSLRDVGVSRILNEGKFLYQVIDSKSDFSVYKVIILPDVIEVDGELKEKLDDFVKAGGKLFATGISGTLNNNKERKFYFDFGVRYIGECEFEPTYAGVEDAGIDIEQAFYVMYKESEDVELNGGRELIGKFRPYFNRTVEHFCSHRHTPCSGEHISVGMSEGMDGIYVAWQLFRDYAEDGNVIYRKIAVEALKRLLGTKRTLETNLYAQGIVTLAKQKNRFILHMLYASPVKRGKNIDVIEDLPQINDTKFKIRLGDEFNVDRIKRVYMAPQNKDIDFTAKGNTVEICVDRFVCHQMVVMEF